MKRAVLVKKRVFTFSNIKDHMETDDFYDVKLGVRYCGICGSDVSKYLENKKTEYPIILGHEFCGYIKDGPNNLDKKKLYVGIPLLYCGECHNCRKGNYQLCTNQKFIGSTIPGAMQEYVLTNSKYLLDVDRLSKNAELATLIEPTANVIHAYKLAPKIKKNDKVVIIGNGAIGSLLAIVLEKYGIKNIDILNRQNEGVQNNYDVCFECSGTIGGFEKALKVTKYRGTIVQLGIIYANCFNNCSLDFDLLLRKEIKIIGSWNSNFTTDWEDAYKVIADNQKEFLNVIDLIYPIEKVNEAFELKTTTPIKKIVLKIA